VRPLTWTTCYSYVTMITLPRRLAELPTAPFLDSLPQSARAIGVAGLNERGLSVAALWDDPAQLPTSSEYFQAGQSQAALNVVEFLLGGCETVSEVQDALSENLVWLGVSCFGKEGKPLSFQYVAHDAAVKSLVIAAEGGELKFRECG